MRLAKLQKPDKEARRIRTKGPNRYNELDGVLYYQGLPFIPEIIQTEIIS